MKTYKDAFNKLINGLKTSGSIEYKYYDFANKQFSDDAQSRICHFTLKDECEYNQDALIMVFTIGKNVNRVVIQSEGGNTANPSSTYPQKMEALRVAKTKGWKYIALAISSDDFENETIRDYVISIESTSYAKATVCVLDKSISLLEKSNYPDFYRCKVKASDYKEYTLSFIKKNKLIDYITFFDNRDEVQLADDLPEVEDDDIFSGFEAWLTSDNNPDYTGSQKYSGYAEALEKLIKYMADNDLIEDDNLNEKNTEKYEAILDAYNDSEDAQAYDKTHVHHKRGVAALKKYIKYIAYLMAPHAIKFDYSITKNTSINKIFYGVPGCGKSHHIQHKILGTTPYIRTTFYQDYSNTDFVGQILPKVVKGEEGEKDTVEYIFNPGPFTLALIKAISSPKEKVALVIEEINRGNAPAIFGDIFQLLDRDDNCISEYGIKNVGMIDYLNSYEFTVDGEKKRYHFDEIKIPGNLDIYATMNTSDQNVYTLDTAFTRRWSKEHIPNEFDGHKIEKMYVPGMPNYTWGAFVDVINNQIRDNLGSLQVNEDKQVGAFFVKEKDLLEKPEDSNEQKAKMFAYKVLEYIWADVSKLDHHVVFNQKYTTFEAVVKDFANGIIVFNDKLGFKAASVSTITEE